MPLPSPDFALDGGEEPAQLHESDEVRHYVSEFRLENGVPFWKFEAEGCVIGMASAGFEKPSA